MPSRKTYLALHLLVGLIGAIFLFVEGVTGGIMAWGPEIFRIFNPPGPRIDAPVYRVPSNQSPLSIAELTADLEKARPGSRLATMQFPDRSDRAWSAVLQSQPLDSRTVWFDPHTGEILGERVRAIRSNWLQGIVGVADRLHGNIVGGVALFLLSLSGLILWWPRSMLVPGRPASFARTNFEAHNVIGFYSSAFLLIFSATAMVMATSRPSIAILRLITRSPGMQPPAESALFQEFAPLRGELAQRARNSDPMSVDEILKEASSKVPEAHFTGFQTLNLRAGDLMLSFRPEGALSSQIGYLFLNPRAGRLQVQAPQNAADYGLPEKIVRIWARRIHSGDIFGRPTRWITGFFSFMLAILAVTGPAIWWARRRGSQI